MRELHGWHGDRHRHAQDAAVDVHAKHAADSPRLRVLWDPEVRKAEFFKYQKRVLEYEAKHAAGQLKPQEEKPEHTPPEIRECPSADRETKAALAEVDERTARLPDQAAKKRKPERSWLPRADMVKAISDIGMLVTATAAALGDVPAKWDVVAASGVAVVVSNIAWANRRWKEKHGDRPEG
jgi:hypothetical protein